MRRPELPGRRVSTISISPKESSAKVVARYVQLGDNLPANNLYFDQHRYELKDTSWLHWRHRCESHQYNMVTSRPFQTNDYVNAPYAFRKLTRHKPVRTKLEAGVMEIVDKELPNNIHIDVRPDPQSILLLQMLVDFVLLPLLHWTADSFDNEVLGSLTNVRSFLVARRAVAIQTLRAFRQVASRKIL